MATNGTHNTTCLPLFPSIALPSCLIYIILYPSWFGVYNFVYFLSFHPSFLSFFPFWFFSYILYPNHKFPSLILSKMGGYPSSPPPFLSSPPKPSFFSLLHLLLHSSLEQGRATTNINQTWKIKLQLRLGISSPIKYGQDNTVEQRVLKTGSSQRHLLLPC